MYSTASPSSFLQDAAPRSFDIEVTLPALPAALGPHDEPPRVRDDSVDRDTAALGPHDEPPRVRDDSIDRDTAALGPLRAAESASQCAAGESTLPDSAVGVVVSSRRRPGFVYPTAASASGSGPDFRVTSITVAHPAHLSHPPILSAAERIVQGEQAGGICHSETPSARGGISIAAVEVEKHVSS